MAEEASPADLSEEEWRQRLDPDRYYVLRQAGTERAFSGEYTHPGFEGTFRCAGCDAELFSPDDQFDSGSGWPSFTQPVDVESVEMLRDSSYGMQRVEVRCRRCGGHLGHVFPDGPGPTGQRWCINSLSLELDEQR